MFSCGLPLPFIPFNCVRNIDSFLKKNLIVLFRQNNLWDRFACFVSFVDSIYFTFYCNDIKQSNLHLPVSHWDIIHGAGASYSVPTWQQIPRTQISAPTQTCCGIKTCVFVFQILQSCISTDLYFFHYCPLKWWSILSFNAGNSTLPKRCPELSEKIISEKDNSLS